MFCPKCGLQLPNGTNFCPRCGTPLNAQYNQPPVMQQTPPPANPQQQNQPESVSDGIAKGCGAFILAILIIVVAIFVVMSVQR